MVGPQRATISAIAQRARVQRLTVYRHFPTLRDLFRACSGLHRATYPWPDPEIWKRIADPEKRVRKALTELFAYYARTASLWANVLRDAETSPLVQEAAAHRFLYLRQARDALAAGWGRSRRRPLLLALAHAVSYRTWESLVRFGGASDREAVRLLVLWVRSAVGSPRSHDRRRSLSTGRRITSSRRRRRR